MTESAMHHQAGIYPAVAVVDLDAISANVATLAQYAGGAEVMAVAKADAYGHGLIPCVKAMVRGGASWIAVAQPSEAIRLREAGIQVPVLSWLLTPHTDCAPVVERDIHLGVSAPWGVQSVARAAEETGKVAQIHLKADTGLARGGAFTTTVGGRSDWEDLVRSAAQAQAQGLVEVDGLFSHFANADSPGHPSIREQEEAFADAVAVAERAGLRPRLRHLANSAGTLTVPSARWDMVRPGVSVYGLTPAPEAGSSADFGLIPAMTALAWASVVKRVPAGQGVSYGHTYRAGSETTMVDVPVGYADGVPRHISNNARVGIGGQQFPVAGRVCMDQFVVDAGDTPVQAGDKVVLFGTGADGGPTAQDWAEAAGTINYEIVTRLGPRVPRQYVGQV